MSFEFRRTMPIKVNGIEATGVVVVPRSPSYRIQGKIKGTAEALFIDTCHREAFFENQGEVDYSYTPEKGIEDNRACPLEIVALDNKAKHALAVVEFEDDRTTLPATLICNAETLHSKGVSICQAAIDQIEQIKFDFEVRCSTGTLHPDCANFKTLDNKLIEFRPKKGICTLECLEQVGGRFHRMTIVGFDRNILKEL